MISLVLASALAAGPADQVVSLSITWQAWESAQPWQKTNPAARFAQATVVPGRGAPWLLTTAQSVENATLVRVRKHGEPAEWIATVAVVDREANLALLSVDDRRFFEDLRPVKLARKPVAQGDVSIVRWKDNQLEATEGRVARATTFDVPTGVLEYVGLQVTTDLVGGGAAEAVLVGSELVGVASAQARSEATVIPATFIGPWLEAVRTSGTPPEWVGDIGVSAQSMRSPALASWLGTGEPRGILILDVARGGSACGVLERRDVLVSVDGRALDADGNVKDELYGTLSWEYLLSRHHAGDTIPAQVIRGGKTVDLQMPLLSYPASSWLIPAHRTSPPPYLMAGGLVFREFDESYQAFSPELRIVADTRRRSQTPERRRVVVLASVLADPYTLGYHALGDLMVETINGKSVGSLADAQAALASPSGGFHVIALHPNPRVSEIVLDAAEFAAATDRIAANYGVYDRYRAPTPPPDLGACVPKP
jgi:hypothetical protein